MFNIIPQIKTAIFLMIVGLLLATVTAVLIMMVIPGIEEITTAAPDFHLGKEHSD